MSDIFAVAAGDSSCDEGSAEEAVSVVVPAPQEVASDAPPAAVRRPPVARPGRSEHGKNTAVRKRKMQAPTAKSKLERVDPGATSDEHRWMTVFLQPRADAGPKRQRVAEDLVPVTLWPQYTVPTLSGRFIVFSPSEAWLAKMLQTLRLRSGDPPSRILIKSLWESIRVMLRRSLSDLKQGVTSHDDDDDQYNDTKLRRSFSGFALDAAFLLEVNVGGCALTIANSGRQLIALLDDKCFRFIDEAVVQIIHQLSDAPVSADEGVTFDAPRAPFRFDDSLPNIRDKVIWCTDRNGWKVLVQGKTGGAKSATYRFVDAVGKTLCVDTKLDAISHERAKRDACIRAIACWSELDQSKRHRITAPLTNVELASSSPSKSDTGSVAELAERGRCS